MEEWREAALTGDSRSKREKRCKLANGKNYRKVNADRISTLPDQVLYRILSFLPTKYAVGTSILSRRWRYLWTKVTNLHFDDKLVLHREKLRKDLVLKNTFMNFVDRVLILHRAEYIQKFYLRFVGIYDPSRVNAWISAAIMHDVVEVDLRLWVSMMGTVQLPLSLYRCDKLMVLKLHDEIVLNVPMSVSLPSLKVLHLKSLRSLDDASVSKLLFGSPVLEELVIMRRNHDDARTLYIHSSSLKNLTIHTTINNTEESYHYEVVINAPKLELLDLTDYASEELNMIQLPSLVKAVINIDVENACSKAFADFVDMVVQLLREISNVKILCLSEFTMEVLNAASGIDLPGLFNLPNFHNLTYLEVINNSIHAMFFADILDCTPNLEVLVFFNRAMWNPPESVPECMFSSLKVVQFKCFCAAEEEMQIIEYLLENAAVLNRMTISYHSGPEESAVMRKLLMLPRASSSCRILFS